MRSGFVFGSASLALVGVAIVAACSTGEPGAPAGPLSALASADGGAGPGVASGAVTFHEHVRPILENVCQRCHVAAGIAPFPLVSYDDARSHAEAIAFQTEKRLMPPWGAQTTAECAPPHPWKNDLRLDDAQIATLAAWKAAGMPEGDPAKAPPPVVAAPVTTLEGGTSLSPAVPYELTSTSDAFRCFVLDPEFTTTTNIDATFFVPKNRTIVHHALAYAIPPGATAPPDQYDCFGGPDVDGANLIAAWAPGGSPTEYPKGVALPVEAGTKFVVQVHYHPHANASFEPDATAFQYRITNEAPSYVALPVLLGNFTKAVNAKGIGLELGPDDRNGVPEFRIPAAAAAHVETMRYTVPPQFNGVSGPKLRVLGLLPHMHYAAQDQRIAITKAGATADQCLVQVPQWNFDWQRNYLYDAPIDTLPEAVSGDILRVRCTYDNSPSNGRLALARKEASAPPAADIKLGESSLDEMCIGAFTFVYPAK